MFKIDILKLPLLQRVYFRVVRISVGIGLSTLVGFHCVPHVFPNIVGIARGFDCQALAVPQEYCSILNDACTKFNINSQKVHLCYSSGFDTISAGTLFLPNGAFIALPRNYTLGTEEDFLRARIAHKGKPVDWDSGMGLVLKKTLSPDSSHLKFLIAHELVHIKDADFASTSLLKVGYIYGIYKVGLILPSFFPPRPFLKQILMQSSIWLMGFLIYMQARRWVSHGIEFKADKGAALLGIDYCNSGIDYMKNRLKLNRVLRKLDPLHGDEKYTKLGNEKVDGHHPKRTERLKVLKSIRDELYLDKK